MGDGLEKDGGLETFVKILTPAELPQEDEARAELLCSIKLKKRIYQILLEIRNGALGNQYPMPGMFLILGYNSGSSLHNNHFCIGNKSQNIFEYAGDNVQISESIMQDNITERILQTKDFEGAVLIDSTGYITNSGAIIEGIEYRDVLNGMNLSYTGDLSESFGFCTTVGTRNLAAISASHIMLDLTTYTLSRRDGIIRVFEEGRILYSTHPDELARKQE